MVRTLQKTRQKSPSDSIHDQEHSVSAADGGYQQFTVVHRQLLLPTR